MSTLYLDRKDMELRADGSAIALYEHGTRVSTVPMRLLERVVIRANTSLTSGLLGQLADSGVSVIILSGRQGNKLCSLHGRPHNDARIRIAQYQLAQDDAKRKEWIHHLVRSKIKSQIRFVQYAAEQRQDARKPLHDAITTINTIYARLEHESFDASCDTTILLGLEGAAQAAYFRAYASLFPASLQFTGRNRRPPRDPVNACLSLGYTLIHFEAVRTAYSVGLDPFIGVYHAPSFARESLACDLIEPFRSRLDAWVWELFRNRVLRTEHFRSDKGACLLDKTGRRHFYEK